MKKIGAGTMKYTLTTAKEDEPIYKEGFTISSVRRTPDNKNEKKEVNGKEDETIDKYSGKLRD